MSRAFVKQVLEVSLAVLGVSALIACLTLFFSPLSVRAADPTPTAVSSTPTAASTAASATSLATPTPACTPKAQQCSGGVSPNTILDPAITGWKAASKTSMSFCNGKLYVAFAQADQRIVVAWNWNGTLFANSVKYMDTAFHTTGYYSAPALACWKPASGPYSDQTRLWIAQTGTNQKLYYGFLTDSDVNNQWMNPSPHPSMPNQSSVKSPALSVQSQTLRYGWVGPSTKHFGFQSTTNASTWFSINTWTTQTASAGFGMWLYCPFGNCNLYFAWPGTDSGRHINIGFFSLAGGNWNTISGAVPLPNQTCDDCDLTFVGQDSVLRLPYAGRNLDMNVLNSDNTGINWSNDTIFASGAVFGASGAVVTGDHLWLTWVDNPSTDVYLAQYN